MSEPKITEDMTAAVLKFMDDQPDPGLPKAVKNQARRMYLPSDRYKEWHDLCCIAKKVPLNSQLDKSQLQYAHIEVILNPSIQAIVVE